MPFAAHLDALMRRSGISAADFARSLSYDPSFMSRVRSGQRVPQDAEKFADDVSAFVLRRCRDRARLDAIAKLVGASPEVAASHEQFAGTLKTWLLSEDAQADADPAELFIAALDAFKLDEFMGSLSVGESCGASTSGDGPDTPDAADALDAADVPMAGRPAPDGAVADAFAGLDAGEPVGAAYVFTGVEGLRAGELAFLRIAATCDPGSTAVIYSDMEMSDLAASEEFSKAWMVGLAALVKRGVFLDLVHDTQRPGDEMALGLLSWVPLYMTGMIRPAYLPGPRDSVFRHGLRVCDRASVEGLGVVGAREHDRYIVSLDPAEVARARTCADDILARSRPLMEIFPTSRRNEVEAFLTVEEATAAEEGVRIERAVDVRFPNIAFTCRPGAWVMVSKAKDPAIDFVVRHPSLLAAIGSLVFDAGRARL